MDSLAPSAQQSSGIDTGLQRFGRL